MSSVMPRGSRSSSARRPARNPRPPCNDSPRNRSAWYGGAIPRAASRHAAAIASRFGSARQRRGSAPSDSSGTRTTRMPRARAVATTAGQTPGRTCTWRWLSIWVTFTPTARSRSSCAAHSAATSADAIRPASTRATSVARLGKHPVWAWTKLRAALTGAPAVRFRWSPTPRPESAAWSAVTASPQPGAFTSTDTDDTTPAAYASRMPRVTPGDSPKSSAFTTSRRSLGVASPPVVPANPREIAEHRHRVGGEPHGAGLVLVAVVHGGLANPEPVLARDVEELDVEPEAGDCQAREDQLRGATGETLETRLRVEDPRQQGEPHDAVEHPAHQVSRIEVVEERWAHEVARFGQHAARDRQVAAGLELAHDPVDFLDWVREIGVGENPIAALRGAHPARHRVSLSLVRGIVKQRHAGHRVSEVHQHARGARLAVIVHQNQLGRPRACADELAQRLEMPGQAIRAVVHRNDDGEVSDERGHEGQRYRGRLVRAGAVSRARRARSTPRPATRSFPRPIHPGELREHGVRHHPTRFRHCALGSVVPRDGIRAPRRLVPRSVRPATGRRARRADRRYHAEGPLLGVADDRAHGRDGRAHPASDRARRRGHRAQPRCRTRHSTVPSPAPPRTPLDRGGLSRRHRLQTGTAQGRAPGRCARTGGDRLNRRGAAPGPVRSDRRCGAPGTGRERGPAHLPHAGSSRLPGGRSPRRNVIPMVAPRSRDARAPQDDGEELGPRPGGGQCTVPVRARRGHPVLRTAWLGGSRVPLHLGGSQSAQSGRRAARVAVAPARPPELRETARGNAPVLRYRAVAAALNDSAERGQPTRRRRDSPR